MGLSIIEYIDREISNYSEYHWSGAKAANDTPFTLADFRNCYIMQVIKEAYYDTEPKKSLRSLRGTDDDDVRMQDSRNMAYVQHYRNLQYEDILQEVGYSETELLPDDVESMKGRIEGHKNTAMQYFEMNTIAEHPLLKAIVNKRICDVKKISNDTFREYMQDYDDFIQKLLKGLDGDSESVVFSAIALYTLEWKYNVELFYACAVNAEENHTTEIPTAKISELCATAKMSIHLDSWTPDMLHIESRFILHRVELVPFIYNGAKWEPFEDKMYHYLEMNYDFDKILIHHDSLAEYYGMVSTRDQWADFILKNYNLKELFKPKEWTNKRIRYMRSLYSYYIKNLPTPK